MNAKLGVISEICCTFAMTIYFRFPQNRPYKAVWGIILFLMQRYKKSMTLAIKSLSLFELICDYPYIRNAHKEISKNPERRCFVIFEVTGDALGCHPLPHFCNVERGYGWCYL